MNLLFLIFSSLCLVSALMVIQSRNPVHSVLFLILVFFNGAGLLLLLGLDFMSLIFLVVYVGAIAVLFLFVVMMLSIKLAEINEKRLRYLPISAILFLLFCLEIGVVLDNDYLSLISFDSIYPIAQYPASLNDPSLLSKGAIGIGSEVSSSSAVNQQVRDIDSNFAFLDFLRNIKFNEIVSLGYWSESLGVEHLNKIANINKSDIETLPVYVCSEDPIYQYNYNIWSQLFFSSSNIEDIGLSLYTYYFFFFLLASLILLVAMIGAILLTMSKQVSIKRQKIFQQNTRSFSETVARFS